MAILSDGGTDASSRAALLVGRMSVFTASDWMSSGTSSVPMLPEADVMKTLDMLVNLCSGKDQICLLQNGSESVYTSNGEEIWKIYSSSYNPWSSIEDIGSGPGQNQVLSKKCMHCVRSGKLFSHPNHRPPSMLATRILQQIHHYNTVYVVCTRDLEEA